MVLCGVTHRVVLAQAGKRHGWVVLQDLGHHPVDLQAIEGTGGWRGKCVNIPCRSEVSQFQSVWLSLWHRATKDANDCAIQTNIVVRECDKWLQLCPKFNSHEPNSLLKLQ